MLVFLNEKDKENKSIILTPVLNNHSRCNSNKYF